MDFLPCQPGKSEKWTRMNTGVIALTDDNFEKETSQGVVMIDFWAPRCPPCRTLGPILERVAETVAGKAKVGKYNVDEYSVSADRFNFRNIPTLIILKDNMEAERLVGLQLEADLVSAILRHT